MSVVNGGTVRNDANSLKSYLNQYRSEIEGLDSSWKGPSHDSLVPQMEEFLAEYEAIISQMESFASACDKYNTEYEVASQRRDQYIAASDRATTDEAKSSYADSANDETAKMNELGAQITPLLTAAKSPSLSATELSANSFLASKGIASGDFVNYYQYNYSDPYGGGTIANWGCGPTALAMVLTYLTGDEITPVQTAADGNNGYVCDDGTLWTFFPDIAAKYGVNCQQVEPTRDNIVNNLKNGTPVIINMGPGTFTSGGHFLVLRGLDENGRVIIADPANESRTNTTWDLDIFPAETNGGMWTFSV